MKESPLIILASGRFQSDTKSFVDFVFKDVDHTIAELLNFNISPFNYSGNYPNDDEFYNLIGEIIKYKTIIFATPVYWYSMSGLMKNFFDRFTDLVTIRKETGRKLSGKSMFLIAVGTDEKLPTGFETPFKLTAEYFDMTYKNSVYFSIKHQNTDRYKLEKKNKFIDEIKSR
ncbi:MAG: NAD(P)H-dependent oxidoreductase [Ginsengibacter sp.]